MKTNYFFTKKISIYSVFGLLALLLTSCGSYQNTSYYDNDGVYGNDEKPKVKQESNENSQYYKDYFSSLKNENDQVFTDVENYSSYNDTIKKTADNTQVVNEYSGWGSNPDNVTVNIYNNGWNNGWYGNNWGWNNWGWNNGWYGNNWGWNNWGWNNGWYGNNWGWNSWYGPSWGWGYGYNPYYGYYGNNWGWNNGHLGQNYAYSNGRRNSNYVSNGNGGGYVSNRSSLSRNSQSFNGTRTNTGGIRPSSPTRNDMNTGGVRPSTNVNQTGGVRPTRSNDYPTGGVRPSSPSSTNSTYTPPVRTTPTRSYDTPTRSYTPSSSSSGGGFGGGSSSGGGGGRSGGGGGRR